MGSIKDIRGKITPQPSITGKISGGSGAGTGDHKKLTNRDAAEQHPISAITNLQTTLDEKLDAETALPLIEEAIKYKAKGLFYDINKELSNKPYWYLTSEIDPVTKQGTKASVISGPYDLGQGGGGGGGVTEVTLNIALDPESGKPMWPYNISVGSECIIGVKWSSLRDSQPTGRGTLYVYVGGKLVETRAAAQGIVTFDLTKYIVSGENKIEVKVIDAYSTTKNFIDTITGITLRLASNFDDALSYTGDISFPYTPTGDITKYVYFFVDGVQQGLPEVVDTTGEQWIRVLPSALFNHGSHTLKVYFTCLIDGEDVKSNELYYDIIYYETGKTTPIIASPFITPAEYEQYVSFNIKYRVYTPNKNTSKVTLYSDGSAVKTLTVDSSYQLWENRFDIVGDHTLQIKSGSATKEFKIHTSESTIHVDPVSQGVELALSAYGRDNTEDPAVRCKWDYTYKDAQEVEHTIEGKLSGFNWTSNGWIKDTDGNTVLRLSGDARLSIEYKPFEVDFTGSGKTFEFEIATSDVKSYESRIGECLDGADTITYSQFYAGEDTRTKKFRVSTVDNTKFIEKVLHVKGTYIFKFNGEKWDLDGTLVSHDELLSIYGISVVEIGGTEPIVKADHYMNGDRIIIYYTVSGRGFYITPQLAKLQSQQTSLSTQYKEDDKVRLTFVVESRSEGTATFKTKLIYMYINGVMSGVSRYPDGDSFQQSPAKFITFGSNDATLDIYNIRIYKQALTRRQVVNNWIADTKDPVLKTKRYRHNDNYDNDTGKIVISKIEALGNLPYLVAETPTLPSYKKDRKYAKVTYVNPGDPARNFTTDNTARMDVQGTSSSGYFRKNFKIKYEGGFYDKDQNWDEHYHLRGKEISKKEKEFTYKADVASSEGANNVELVRYFEDSKNWFSPPELQPDTDLGTLDSKLRIRVGIDGLPIVMFHNDGEKTYFYGKMNFNNDKGNKRTYGFATGDESWEFLHNTSDLVLFKTDDLTNWAESFESRYPEEAGEDEHPYGTLPEEREKLQAVMTWVVSTYRKASDSEEVKAQKLKKFKDEFTQHFNLTSSLFYYLYTELFLMVDSRAKNAMLTYMASRDGGYDGGNRWFWFPYDMDTALGINNEGLLVYNYDKEDTDLQEGAYIFNGQDSVFWNNVRDAFPTELQTMYNTLRSSSSADRVQWSFANAEKYFEDHQSVWSESIFNEDSYEKYLYPYIYNQDATYLGMAQGSKEQQRRWWMYNRFRYLDSKYLSGDANACQIMMRPYWSHSAYKAFDTLEEYAGLDKHGQPYYILFHAGTESAYIKTFAELTPEEVAQVIPGTTIAYVRNTFDLKPYINCYTTVRYEKQDNPVTVKSSIGNVSSIISPSTWKVLGKDAVIWIDSADLLEDVGDLSVFKPGYADFSKATKLKRLVIGNASSTYENGNLTGLNVGANHLLTYLDARNCKNLGVGEGSQVTPTIDLSSCYSIEEAYFDNTQIKGCSFPVGGNLKKVHLPETLTSIAVRNHPNLTEFNLAGTQNLLSIWLEEIPSSAIDAYTYIMAMKAESKVRVIGINETYGSILDPKWTDVKLKEFYAKLNTMHGMDGNGDYMAKAQVTGKIKIPSISYSDLVTYSAMYPEITIEADQIICAVNFYTQTLKAGTLDYEWTLFNSQPIVKGNDAENPGVPTKTPTQQYYYTFNSWDKPYTNIQQDMDIYAQFDQHLQVYRVTFNTMSAVITVDPEFEDIEYGSCATVPVLSGIPEQVIFKGWYYADGTKFSFTTPIVDHLTLYAHWQDESAPVITLTRAAHNKFHYHVTDNVGITGWQVTTTEVKPTIWNEIESTVLLEDDYTITEASSYYFWAKDEQHDDTHEKITAWPVMRELGTGITSISLKESGIEIENFALHGTTVRVLAILDSHYKNLVLKDNGMIINNDIDVELKEAHTFSASCEPKTFLVQFDNLGKGVKPDSQEIVYLHKVIEPDPQFDSGYIIEGWYKDTAFATKWNFNTDVVEGDMTLYAKWIIYHSPTKLTIDIPTNNYNIKFNYSQDHESGCSVDFGDGSTAIIEEPSGLISLSHTYALAGTYTIQITSRVGLYYLGNNFDNQVIMPITILKNIEFAWDVSRTNNYAFRGATGLTTLNLTQFMTAISPGCFEGCSGLTQIDFPSNIQDFGYSAFKDCTGLVGTVTLPNKTIILEGQCFYGCTGITKVVMPNTVTDLDYGVFSDCTSLSEINLSTKLNSIENNLFYNCSSLVSLDIPESVQEIRYGAFRNCKNLEKLVYRNPNLIFDSDGYGMIYRNCLKLHTVGPIGGNYNIEFAFIDKIPDKAFMGDGDMYSVMNAITIPSTIKSIGKRALYGQAFETITLPAILEEVGERAFANNSRLTTLKIPSTVTKLGGGFAAGILTLNNLYVRAVGIKPEYKIEVPDNGWARGCSTNLTIHVMNGLTEQQCIDYYGTYWCYRTDTEVHRVSADIND